MPVVRMPLEKVLSLYCVDFSYMCIKCEFCGKIFVKHEWLGRDCYVARHTKQSTCHVMFYFNTRQIMEWKAEDPQYQDILNSLRVNHGHPIARLHKNAIIDGCHRISAAMELELKYILVETGIPHRAKDSGQWWPHMPIDLNSECEKA